MRKIYFITIILLGAISSLTAFGRSKDAVRVKGVVYQERGTVDGAIIDVFEDGNKKEAFVTKPNGKFKLELDLNKEYIIVVSQFGKCTKKLKLDTHVPKGESGVWNVGFEVELFDIVEGLNVEALEAPIALISYDMTGGYFDYDAKYSALMAEKLEEIHYQFEQLSK